MFFQGGNEDLLNVDRNDSKYKQHNYAIEQFKLQGFKVIYYIQYFWCNLLKYWVKLIFVGKHIYDTLRSIEMVIFHRKKYDIYK